MSTSNKVESLFLVSSEDDGKTFGDLNVLDQTKLSNVRSPSNVEMIADSHTPSIVTSDFGYVRFIEDRNIKERDFGYIQIDRLKDMKKVARSFKVGINQRNLKLQLNLQLLLKIIIFRMLLYMIYIFLIR